MITFEQVANLTEIADWKQAYLQTLVAPLDGYWETAVIARALHFKIWVDGRALGYFAVDKQKRLLQFYALEQADALFTAVFESEWVATAVASTIDPAHLSLCLDRQQSVSVNSYLFHDDRPVEPELPAYPQAQFRLTTMAELAELAEFNTRNNEFEDTETIEELFKTRLKYARLLIERQQSFLLVDGTTILGIGEYRPSQSQPPFADIGMITDREHRQKGVGTFILAQLKQHCYQQNLQPICSCAANNFASRKTIEKAGLVTRHRILDIEFC